MSKNNSIYDIIVVGGGIIGTSTALLLQSKSRLKILLIEAEESLAMHQTGNNSGVIHSGIYYKPGSLKAKNCSEGRELLYRFCDEQNIKYEKCGKVIVAVNKAELDQLNHLYERGIANGLEGLKKLSAEELKEYEPHVSGIAGLFVPQTGIVDYVQVTNTFGKTFKKNGGNILTSCKFKSSRTNCSELFIQTSDGEFRTKFLINCGGLHSDVIAKHCGVKPGLQIIPFRGEYFVLKKEKQHLVKNLVYPVPDINFPFLGVHFTRMINGGVEAGPNAVLAFKREGYFKKDFNLTDATRMFFYPGFWRMAVKYYKIGIHEFYRSFSKKAFVNSLQKLIPEINENDIEHGGSGVRAQALDPSGKLVDDFKIVEAERMIHVLNAPSPAATASISIGRTIADLAIRRIKDFK
ncbi:MAG TPA: L-2-hydroxyglutarate oxidase [Ignavibacteriaceae bacterium]